VIWLLGAVGSSDPRNPECCVSDQALPTSQSGNRVRGGTRDASTCRPSCIRSGETQQRTPDSSAERHPNSGPGTPSLPRGAGTGERQAERRRDTGAEPATELPMTQRYFLF
jgi:hypothetical protein